MTPAVSPRGEQFEYFKLSHPPRIVRRARGGSVAELTSDGWYAAPWLAKRLASKTPIDRDKLGRRNRQRMNETPLDEPAKEQRGWELRRRRLRQWLVPPLEYGAPRRFGDEEKQDRAEATYDQALPASMPAEVRQELVEQARDGYERQGERVAGIERRAALYQGGASISGGIILAGAGLATAHERLQDDTARGVIIVGLALVSLCLLLSGWRAHQASVYTFSWSRPNIRRKILARAQRDDVAKVERDLLTALLLGQDRSQVIAQWKIDRLKQATTYFVYAGCLSLVVTLAFLLAILLDA